MSSPIKPRRRVRGAQQARAASGPGPSRQRVPAGGAPAADPGSAPAQDAGRAADRAKPLPLTMTVEELTHSIEMSARPEHRHHARKNFLATARRFYEMGEIDRAFANILAVLDSLVDASKYR
jgi:hypothetical protein